MSGDGERFDYAFTLHRRRAPGEGTRRSAAKSSAVATADVCTTPGWLLFAERPWLGIAVYVALTVVSAAVGLLEPFGLRATLVLLICVPLVLVVYVPFVVLVVKILGNKYRCGRIPPGYMVYLLAALQVAHAHIFWTLFIFNEERSFTNVCSVTTPPASCTHDDAFLVVGRLFYCSSVTFVSVGYGEIVPISFGATLSVLPLLWTPIFYTGVLLGRLLDVVDEVPLPGEHE